GWNIVPFRLFEFALMKDVQQLFGLPRVQVKPVAAHEFQRVPLRRIVAGGDRNSARRVKVCDRKLHRRRGADAQINRLAAGGEQSGHHRGAHHRPRRAPLTAPQNAPAPKVSPTRLREGDDQFGREGFAHNAPNASDADLQRFHIRRTSPASVARVLRTSSKTRIIPTNGIKPATTTIELNALAAWVLCASE